MGFTAGKEYAELEWPIDIAITILWVVFGINMMNYYKEGKTFIRSYMVLHSNFYNGSCVTRSKFI